MIPEKQNKVLDAWQTSARYWDKYRTLIAWIFAPLTMALVEEARIGIGRHVLDIGGEAASHHSQSHPLSGQPDP